MNKAYLAQSLHILARCLFGETGGVEIEGKSMPVRSKGKPPWLVPVVGPPMVVAGCVFALSMLPKDVLAVLMAWTLGSVPIGVLFGHCVLSEE